ncbi:MAG: 23S rRNA (guanosine(2251)-2'-O)-methyltransferase RlmB [Magnetococcales bacterium]|nr:23S rRNA (guanosine(2251)-2'-O)-methyltransferase RlmB [Magnetococcales bacterium]
MADLDVVFGINAVTALLESAERPVSALFVQKPAHGKRIQKIIDLARKQDIRIRFVDKFTMERQAEGGTHQGVAARTEIKQQPSWDDLLAQIEGKRDVLLLILDGIEDPRNLGAILRSADAFGVTAVIQPKDRCASLTGSAVKASAGAAERVDLVRVTNLARTLRQLEQIGFQIIGLDAEASITLNEASQQKPLALIMGSEGKGLRRLTQQACHQLASIPMHGSISSLNVSVAAGIALYEICREN